MKSKRTKKRKEISKSVKEKLPSAGSTPESRRIFLSKLWKGLGILASVEFITVFFGFLFSGKRTEEESVPEQLFDAGNVSSFPVNSVTPFRGGRFFLARLQDGGFIALSLRCTHLGCSVNWEDKKKIFICPCHSSSYKINGDVISPPAPRALDYFKVIIENNDVIVDIGTRLERKKFLKEQAVYV